MHTSTWQISGHISQHVSQCHLGEVICLLAQFDAVISNMLPSEGGMYLHKESK